MLGFLLAATLARADIGLTQAGARVRSAHIDWASSGSTPFSIRFDAAHFPGVTFTTGEPLDWSSASGVTFKLRNLGGSDLLVGLRVDDDQNSDGKTHTRYMAGTLRQGAEQVFQLLLPSEPEDSAVSAMARTDGIVGWSGAGAFRRDHVMKVILYAKDPPAGAALQVESIDLTSSERSGPVVDKFGQNAKTSFAAKVHTEEDLRSAAAAEKDDLTQHPIPQDRDRFGGDKAAVKRAATGFFHTAMQDGKWTLVDPDGYPFYSMGMDTVDMRGETVISGREDLFEELPQPGDRLLKTQKVGKNGEKTAITYDFYRRNLRAKFGDKYELEFRDLAIERLQSWGFNTIGCFSSKGLWLNGKIPYVAHQEISGGFNRLGREGEGGAVPDPFDPKFEEAARARLNSQFSRLRDDPWCVGFFVDNELSWGGRGSDTLRYRLAYNVMAQDAEHSPAKQALVEWLRRKYGSIGALGVAWGQRYLSWDELSSPQRFAGGEARNLGGDFSEMVRLIARQYFQTVRSALREVAPNQLYLGCRFSSYTPEVLAEAAAACDVVSFNLYIDTPDTPDWRNLFAALGKPVMIGEFHFGSAEEGFFQRGMVDAGSQEGRAQAFRMYMMGALRNPYIVGAHYYQWLDQPLLGTPYDGQSASIGFVRVTDAPYAALVTAARDVLSRAYRIRGGG